jgi:hypothetical protein
LASANFHLFPRLKLTLKGWCFCNVIDIINNATEQLKRITKKSFQGCFQHLYSRWPKTIVAQGGYCKVNVASVIVLFVFLRNTVIPTTFWRYHLYKFHLKSHGADKTNNMWISWS